MHTDQQELDDAEIALRIQSLRRQLTEPDLARRREAATAIYELCLAVGSRAASFVSFMSAPQIHRRVPTCTACYLDLPDRTIDAPGGAGGRLLRFMNDQQSVLLWYLHLRPDGDHAVVAATPAWDDDAEGESVEDLVRLTQVMCCAPTFEEFMLHFWLENSIWFALDRARPLTEAQRAYLDAVRARRKG